MDDWLIRYSSGCKLPERIKHKGLHIHRAATVPFNKTLAYQSVATADLQRQLSVSSQGVELLLAEQQLCGFPDHAQDVIR
jgi:hypothetical protein